MIITNVRETVNVTPPAFVVTPFLLGIEEVEEVVVVVEGNVLPVVFRHLCGFFGS